MINPSISMNRHVTELVRSCNYDIRALRHICPLLTHGIYKDSCARHCWRAPWLLQFAPLRQGTSSDNLRKLQVTQNALARVVCQAVRTCSATELRRQLIGYQRSNASTTNSQFWLTRRAEVRHIWHLSLVTVCDLVHWDRQTNCCLAVLTRP